MEKYRRRHQLVQEYKRKAVLLFDMRTFIIFDIEDFYPSIKESLLKQSLDFAGKYIKVSSEDKAIIKHARNSLLYNKQQS